MRAGSESKAADPMHTTTLTARANPCVAACPCLHLTRCSCLTCSQHTPLTAHQVRYLVEPPPPGADPKRSFKYPFTACEIFCCEVEGIFNTLLENEDLLAQLFSLLQVRCAERRYRRAAGQGCDWGSCLWLGLWLWLVCSHDRHGARLPEATDSPHPPQLPRAPAGQAPAQLHAGGLLLAGHGLPAATPHTGHYAVLAGGCSVKGGGLSGCNKAAFACAAAERSCCLLPAGFFATAA